MGVGAGEVFLAMWNSCFVIYQEKTPSRHNRGVEKGMYHKAL